MEGVIPEDMVEECTNKRQELIGTLHCTECLGHSRATFVVTTIIIIICICHIL